MIATRQGKERIGRRLKLRDLRILMTVVECGTMGKAAERLAISQPVVSKAIANIENALGVRLLDRSQRGVEPTPYGRALIRRGIAIFDEMRQGIEEIEFLSDPTAGEVRIGATDAINAAIVAPVIDRLSRQYPRMTFHVVSGVPKPLRQELAARNVDFVISRFARPVGEEYLEETLFHDALVVVAGPNNPLTRRRKVELAELLSEPWVMDPLITDFGAMQAGARHSTTGRHHYLEESVAQPGRANVHRVCPRIGETARETDNSRACAPASLSRIWPIGGESSAASRAAY
jgi:DNA-binding transcriptional LysR family regulator